MSSATTPHRPFTPFPERELQVKAWNDPVLDSLGHDPRSSYVERYWLPILGPSSTVLLRRIAAELETNPDGFALVSAQWSLEMGLGPRGGRHSTLWRSVERLCRFNITQRNGTLLVARRKLPPLSTRQVQRLPSTLHEAHQAWSDQRLATPRRPTISQWSESRFATTPAGGPSS